MSSAASNPAAAQAPPEPLSMREVLRLTVMRRLWIAQIISVFGDFLALFAVISYLTFHLKARPEEVTGIQIAYMLPIAVLSILAGVFIDRWALKPTMIASDLLRAALCLLLLPAGTVWQFYLILAAISVVSSFFGPAQGVAIRSVVPLHGLRSANALLQQVMFGMRIIGPALAALMVAKFGNRSCYYADSLSFVASAALIASVAIKRLQSGPVTEAPAVKKSGVASILPDMKQGISFIVHHAGLLFVVLAFAAGMFVIGCFGPLIAVYVRDSLHASTQTFGYTSAMIGVGMLVGSNLIGTFGKKLKNAVLVNSGLGAIALGLCLLAFVTRVWTTFLGNLFIGAAVAAIVVPASTLMQQETPPALMGRVGSTFMSIVFTAQLLGLALSGFLANHIGVRQVFMLCAALLVVLIGAGMAFLKPHAQPAAA